MALNGLGYLKTTWAFEERPVASAKLNLWDDRIEAALELVHFVLSLAWGGGDGVVRGATAKDLAVEGKSPPAMAVTVAPGYAFVGGAVYKLAEETETPDLTAPIGQPRKDLVQARGLSWDISVKTGLEGASPEAPEPDGGCIPLAEIYLRVGSTAIHNTDQGTGGYVIDRRNFL